MSEKLNHQIDIDRRRENWKKAYEACNPSQKKAIDTLQDPVLVVAGPGTGKTQILALRIGKILLDTDTSPQSILCLTYTDSGTVAMRKRLEHFIRDDAYKIHIYTFHAFCNSVIKTNPYYFRDKDGFEALSELEELEIYRSIIRELPRDSPLKRLSGDLNYDMERLKSLFTQIKKDNLDIAQLTQDIHESLDKLKSCDDMYYKRNGKDYKKGEFKEKEYRTWVDKCDKLLEAYRLYGIYESKLLALRRYDYHDMIQWVIQAFTKHDELLRNYQERFLYFLVDEYQDTNGSQAKILELLTDYDKSPNVFAVGDDDQCVYTFQGAHKSRMEEFVLRYNIENKLKLIILEQNYRSTQAILDAAQALINNNETRLINSPILAQLGNNISKILKSSNPKYEKENKLFKEQGYEQAGIQIIEYQNHIHEEADIVRQIIELKNQQVPLNEIAILYRKNSQIQHLTKVLNHYEIPFYARISTNIFNEPVIKQIIQFITYLSEETRGKNNGDYLLFDMLHYPYFKIDAKEAIRLVQECQSKKSYNIRQLIGDTNILFSLGFSCLDGFKKLDTFLNNLFVWKSTHTPQMCLEKIIDDSGMLNDILQSDDTINKLEYLNALMNFVKLESAKDPSITLFSILDKLNAMRSHNIGIDVEKISANQNALQLLTAHGSKGLEFDYVFILDCDTKKWEESRSSNNKTFSPPPYLTLNESGNYYLSKKEKNAVDIEEERRIFYVAMTRAKKQLHISYSKMDKKDKQIEASSGKASVFISNILSGLEDQMHYSERKTLQVQYRDCDTSTLADYMVHAILPENKPKPLVLERAFVTKFTENYKLSVTHLSKYLKCPLTFYYENVLRIPRARTAAAGFGNAIHYALEKIFTDWKRKKSFPDLTQALLYAKEGMWKNSSHFTEEEYTNHIQKAEEVMTELYNEKLEIWKQVPNVMVEFEPTSMWEGIPLSGKLDKLEIYGNQIRVVDYKTGKYSNSKEKQKKPKYTSTSEEMSFEDQYGGDYWRQMVFYKILIENSIQYRDHQVIESILEFVEKEDDKWNTMVSDIQQKDIDIVRDQIKMAYYGIQQFHFDGCNKPDCYWCNYTHEKHKEILQPIEADESE